MVEDLATEVVDQIDQLLARQFIALIEVDLVGEDAVELRLVRSFNCNHRLVEGGPDLISRLSGDLLPDNIVGHNEVVHFGILGEIGVAKAFGQPGKLFEVDVANSLEEEQGEDVATEFRVIHIAPEDVRRLVEECIELCLSKASLWACQGGRSRSGNHPDSSTPGRENSPARNSTRDGVDSGRFTSSITNYVSFVWNSPFDCRQTNNPNSFPALRSSREGHAKVAFATTSTASPAPAGAARLGAYGAGPLSYLHGSSYING